MARKDKTEQIETWMELYTNDSEFDSCFVAKVVAESDFWYLLAKVTPGGHSDGFYLIPPRYVYKWKLETEYIQKLKELYRLKRQKHIRYNGDKEDLLMGLLKFAQQKELIVSISLSNRKVYEVQGFVKELEEYFLRVINMDSFGNEDGETIVHIEDISAIACNDENGSDLKLLHSNKSSTTKDQ